MVSSTGMSGAVLLVGWGVVKKDAMELEIESANCGSWAVSAGKIEVPLHDVKTLVLWEFMKHTPTNRREGVGREGKSKDYLVDVVSVEFGL